MSSLQKQLKPLTHAATSSQGSGILAGIYTSLVIMLARHNLLVTIDLFSFETESTQTGQLQHHAELQGFVSGKKSSQDAARFYI